MTNSIYVIVNTYDDFVDTAAVATDGGAFYSLDKAKARLREYVESIWGFKLGKDEINAGFDANELIWEYTDDDGSTSTIEIHKITIMD